MTLWPASPAGGVLSVKADLTKGVPSLPRASMRIKNVLRSKMFL